MAPRSKSMKEGSVAEASTLSVDPHRFTSTPEGRAVWVGRVLFLLCLLVVGGVLGILTWFFLAGAETELAKTQYDSIANRALNEAQAIALRKRQGTVSMASVIAETKPDASVWPFVTISGFEKMATNIIITSSGTSMGLCPIVTPEEAPAFEEFMYDFYENTRNPPFPNGTAVSSFGKGIWAVNPASTAPDNRFHDTTGAPAWKSPNQVLTPLSQHNSGPHPVLMLNPHNEITRGRAIDSIIDCSAERAKSSDPDSIECAVMTDTVYLTSRETDGPGAIMILPIYPADDATVLTAVLLSTTIWSEILVNIFTASVSGIDCVIETETQTHTYTITDGVARYLGDSDEHDPTYDDFRRSIKLSGIEYYNNASATYTLNLYPNIKHYQVYSTVNPTVATIGAVSVILFMAVLFILYDVCVRREFSTKDELLESKRKFVRFVSHEVRTPLNSVSMGLTLMQDELAETLGFDSAEDYLHKREEEDDVALLEKDTIDCPIKKKASAWFNLSHEISVNAQSSVDVLNDLLNYDKVETGTLNLELTVISIWKLIEKTTNEFQLSAAKKKIGFEINFTNIPEGKALLSSKFSCLSEDLPINIRNHMVVGDSVRLTQVLRNLVSNALKFTPQGGKLDVRASWIEAPKKKAPSAERLFVLKSGAEEAFLPSGHLEVQVQDTGAGISVKQLEKLFRHGVQFNVNDLQAGQGSGLGLFIAKGIVEQHEGSLTANSEGLGKGTTFTMKLPMYYLQHIEKEPSEQTGQNDDLSAVVMEPSVLRVLVVDDAASNRKLLSRLLKNRGHESDEAEDGAVALAMVEKAIKEGNPYDSILLDYEMPVMNGPSAAIELRAMGCDVFIIGVTGNMMADDVAYFRSCGANAMMGKPFKIATLEEIWSEYGITGHSMDHVDDIV